MLKQVILVRHAEPMPLEEMIANGLTDRPLTQRGLNQAQAVAENLAKVVSESTTRLLTSDVLRASETAAVISKVTRIRAERYRELREISRGVAENASEAEAALLALPKTSPILDWVPYPKGESWRMMNERIVGCLDAVAGDGRTENVVVVTHGNPLVVSVLWWQQLPEELWTKISYEFSWASITQLTINRWGERTISYLNNTAHLRAEGL